MAGETLPCGHPVGWMLRLRDGPKLYKYCWGCVIALLEKQGLTEVFAESKPSPKKTVKETTSTAAIKKKK